MRVGWNWLRIVSIARFGVSCVEFLGFAAVVLDNYFCKIFYLKSTVFYLNIHLNIL
jgi:hypothetical protein